MVLGSSISGYSVLNAGIAEDVQETEGRTRLSVRCWTQSTDESRSDRIWPWQNTATVQGMLDVTQSLGNL